MKERGFQWIVMGPNHTIMQFHIRYPLDKVFIAGLVEMASRGVVKGFARSEYVRLSQRADARLDGARLVAVDHGAIGIQDILDRIMEHPEYKEALLKVKLEEL